MVSTRVAAAAAAAAARVFLALCCPHRSFQSRIISFPSLVQAGKGQSARLRRGNRPARFQPARARTDISSFVLLILYCTVVACLRRTPANNQHHCLLATRLAALSKGRPNKQPQAAIVPNCKTEPTLKGKVAESSLGASWSSKHCCEKVASLVAESSSCGRRWQIVSFASIFSRERTDSSRRKSASRKLGCRT